LIDRNPFEKLAVAPIAAARDVYVTPEQADRVIEKLPTAEWRLLFGLARYAGLRIPSEVEGLTWDKIDREKGRMSVYAPKTDRTRLVPIVPELAKLIEDAWDACPEGESRVIRIPARDMRETVRAAIGRAGLTPWPRTFQTLRSSCETWL